MGGTPLTKQHWLSFFAILLACSILALIFWLAVSHFLAAHFLFTPIRISLVGICSFLLFFLFWLRFRLARHIWVKLWNSASPWFLACSVLFPTHRT